MDIMIDLETLGSERLDCVFPLIGFATFDPNGEGVMGAGVIKLDAQDQIERGLSVDWGTIQWWLRQEEAARMQLQTDPIEEAYSLTEGLATLARWFSNAGFEPERDRVWAYPSDFDLSILRHAHAVAGMPTPWHRRDTRDAKTFLKASGLRREFVEESVPAEFSIGPDEPERMVKHRPDHDAVRQVYYVQAAARAIGGTDW